MINKETTVMQLDNICPAEYRILIADDERSISELIARALREINVQNIDIVSDGDEAIKQLAKMSYDLFITDMLMPGLHGLELIKRVKETFPSIDIVVMTGHPDEFPFIEVINAGASDFVTKPHLPVELQAKIVRIFKERKLNHALSVSEKKYRNLFELSMNGMLVVDFDECSIMDANRSFCEICGLKIKDLVGKKLIDLIAPLDKERFEQGFGICASGGQGTLGDLAMVDAQDNELFVDISMTFIRGSGSNLIFMAFKDVTEKLEVERRLSEVARMDELTGLSNKRSFSTQLEGIISRARREEFPVTLLFLDLDDFKSCNDNYGHQVGDEVLAKVGELIRDCIRAGGDEGFRYGGDEFAVLLPGAPVTAGNRVAERMRSDFENGENYGITLSIGVAEYKQEMHATAFVRAADDALYQAKADGKNKIHIA